MASQHLRSPTETWTATVRSTVVLGPTPGTVIQAGTATYSNNNVGVLVAATITVLPDCLGMMRAGVPLKPNPDIAGLGVGIRKFLNVTLRKLTTDLADDPRLHDERVYRIDLRNTCLPLRPSSTGPSEIGGQKMLLCKQSALYPEEQGDTPKNCAHTQ